MKYLYFNCFITFNKKERSIKTECWPRFVDVRVNREEQYPGWPITINQYDCYAKEKEYLLPELIVESEKEIPLVKLYDADELIYAYKPNSNTFQLKTFKEGVHKVILYFEKEDKRPFYGIILGNEQGRTVYKKQLMGLVEKHRLNTVVKFINHCKEMPVVYKFADVVVSASIQPEAFGRISVEAQSMSKPIIATNMGGSKETIINEKTGFLFESTKADTLAEMLYRLMKIDDKLLKSIGSEGRKNVLKKFDVEKMCNTTFTEYKKLIQ